MIRELIVDLHIHSKYSYATSPRLDLMGLDYWARVKGIDVLGTGDFTHPEWMSELQAGLILDDNGLYRLADEQRTLGETPPESVVDREVWFIPTVEISTVYSRGNKLRKVHSVVVMPSLKLAQTLNKRLSRYGNLLADGRPTLGLDTEELLKIVLDVSDEALLIPAHVWTPWFGLFGSKSGFDSLEEAFGDYTQYIYALETGLSSDPAMNRKLSQHNHLTLVSNSDAHSCEKLAREGNVMVCEPSYSEIIQGIKTGDERFRGTIEFYPQEGKYYADGHRKCQVCTMPDETKKLVERCPKCGKQMTIGVLNRVLSLADVTVSKSTQKNVEYIFPLTEMLADLMGLKHDTGKRVTDKYFELIQVFGSEFEILRKIALNRFSHFWEELGLAVGKMRQGKVRVEPGYDGVFGKVKIQVGKDLQKRLF